MGSMNTQNQTGVESWLTRDSFGYILWFSEPTQRFPDNFGHKVYTGDRDMFRIDKEALPEDLQSINIGGKVEVKLNITRNN